MDVASQMSTSLATVATLFLEQSGLAHSTIKSYEYALLPLLKEYGKYPIKTIDRAQLEGYLKDLSHLKYTTHRRHQAIVHSLFNFAVDRDYLRSNPMTGLRARKPDPLKGEHESDRAVRYLVREQMELLFRAIGRDCRMNAIARLLYRSGARISELLALDLAEVDFERRKFQVVGKGNKQRWCYFSEDVDRPLETYLTHFRYDGSPALFTARQPQSKSVSRLSYRTVYGDWKRLIESIDRLQGVRLHDLRHTFATERVGLMGIEELRALMGHESIHTTLRYQKVTSERAERVAKEAFNYLLNSPLQNS